jgi:hypothetical protein
VGVDAKLSLAKGIPIPIPGHVVSLKSTTTDLAHLVASESPSAVPSALVQLSAHGPSIVVTVATPSGTRPISAPVVAPSRMEYPWDLFHVFEPEEVVRFSFEASQPTGYAQN